MPTDDPQPDPTRTVAPDRPTLTAAADVTGSLADPAAATGGPADRPESAPPSPAAARYALGAEIARGGMGAVYRATDTAFSREVAVKVLLDRFAPTSGTARRFADEARITGQLQHPAIPAVHDLGVLPDGRPFLAMKLIKGDTLDDLLKARPDPAADRGRFIAAFEQVCQAVAYAHAHRVIHRDLKPANVMVGAYGEVQVMDWGLAKVLGTRTPEVADPDATVAQTAVASLRQTDSAVTLDGSVLGTPAYMPPEQAVGAVHKVDARSDVFGLGAILAVILTGKPPFVGSSAATTRLKAAQGDVDECFERLAGCGAEPELVALCRRCLSRRADDRPADAGEVATAVAELRAAADERARQAELDRVKAEGDKATAEARAAEERNTRREAEARVRAEQAKAEEQRKRRRVQLALAGVVLAAAVAGGIAAVQVQRQRDADRFAAEQMRVDDLRAADEDARARQQAAKAADLVRALADAEPRAVPVLLNELAGYRDAARPHLLRLAALLFQQSAGLRGRLALLADPDGLSPTNREEFEMEVRYRSSTCPIDEFPLILDYYASHGRDQFVADGWGMLEDPLLRKLSVWPALRLAVSLARFDPANPRWEKCGDGIAGELVRLNPLEVEPYVASLGPVRGHLIGPLLRRYPQSRAKIESGTLTVSDLAAEATAFDLTASLLARYAADRPAELAELAVTVDARHYRLFAEAIGRNKAAIIPLLKAELARSPGPVWAVHGGGVLLAAVAGGAVAREALDPDPVIQAEEKRRGYAAAALLTLGEGEAAWPVFRFPADGDPTARSYLLERLAGIGADPAVLVNRFALEADVSAQRALLVALGDFPPERVPEREAFAAKLLTLYREHPDSGLHSAIDWLLRQKWGKGAELTAIDAGLAAAARLPVVARRLADIGPLPVSPLLPALAVAAGRDWYVTGEGQTFAVVRDPAEFTLGSPVTEPGRIAQNEPPHHKRVGRTYAIATKEVTVAEFLRFRPQHEWQKQYSPGPDTPAVEVRWYDAAEYCNWLSAREGIPADQWCYEPANGGGYGEGMRMRAGHLKLTGYRLPTEAEWECAGRAGTGTSRPYGRGEELLPRYGWCVRTSDARAWPVGGLRPNERGLFDGLGNAVEWCEDPGLVYVTSRTADQEDGTEVTIDERIARLLRGGSFVSQPVGVRSAYRGINQPGNRIVGYGFRPARTLP